jgi:hypothetical protein
MNKDRLEFLRKTTFQINQLFDVQYFNFLNNFNSYLTLFVYYFNYIEIK